MHSVEQIQGALEVIHYTAPCIIFVFFMLAITASICTVSKEQVGSNMIPTKTRQAITITMLLVALSYVSDHDVIL